MYNTVYIYTVLYISYLHRHVIITYQVTLICLVKILIFQNIHTIKNFPTIFSLINIDNLNERQVNFCTKSKNCCQGEKYL